MKDLLIRGRWSHIDRNQITIGKKAELEEYKRTSATYRRMNVKPGTIRKCLQNIRAKYLYSVYMGKKIWRSLERRTGLIKVFRA